MGYVTQSHISKRWVYVTNTWKEKIMIDFSTILTHNPLYHMFCTSLDWQLIEHKKQKLPKWNIHPSQGWIFNFHVFPKIVKCQEVSKWLTFYSFVRYLPFCKIFASNLSDSQNISWNMIGWWSTSLHFKTFAFSIVFFKFSSFFFPGILIWFWSIFIPIRCVKTVNQILEEITIIVVFFLYCLWPSGKNALSWSYSWSWKGFPHTHVLASKWG